MTDQTPAHNILKFDEYTTRLGAEEIALVRKVQDAALDVLNKLTRHMLDRADDALFELSNKAGDGESQAHYFDAMRTVRLKRAAIEAGLNASVSGRFDQFVMGQDLPAMQPGGEAPDDDPAFELVNDEEVEELVAMKNMAAKGETLCSEELYALAMRLRALTKWEVIDSTNHPIAPAAVAQGFGDAMQTLDADIQVRLILYKLFDKYVMSNIVAVYRHANGLLIREGILPKVRREAHKNPNAPDSGGDNPLGDLAGRPELRVVVTDGMGIVGALSELQGAMVATGYPQDLTPEQIGAHVLGLYRQTSEDINDPQQISADEKTINMVSMIFDYILDDRNIADGIKAMIGRLQIPVLKVALSDRQFFARKTHPVRRLLNEMGRASVGLDGAEKSVRETITEAISATVNRLLDEFDDDISLFDTSLQEFLAVLKRTEERSQVFEERTRKTAEGRERVDFVRLRTDAWIEMWNSRDSVPPFVQEFLRGTWRSYLLITMHRHGEDGPQWAAAIKTVNNLLWSLAPKKTATGGRLLVEMLPGIIQELRQGMEVASAHPANIDQFFRELARLHAKTVNGGVDRQFPEDMYQRPSADGSGAASGDPSTELGSDDSEWGALPQVEPEGAGVEEYESFLEEIEIHAPEEVAPATPEGAHDQYSEQAEQMRCGTWVEFAGTGDPVYAKLSWRSPLSGCCLFVNHTGAKVAEKSTAELADALRSGKASVLENVPLLDRAIDAVKDDEAEQLLALG